MHQPNPSPLLLKISPPSQKNKSCSVWVWWNMAVTKGLIYLKEIIKKKVSRTFGLLCDTESVLTISVELVE